MKFSDGGFDPDDDFGPAEAMELAERNYVFLESEVKRLGTEYDRLRAENERLKAERDDLYAACKAALSDIPERSPIRPILLAAIAKADGQTEEQAK